MSAAMLVTYNMNQENAVRIDIVKAAAAQGEPIAYTEPIKMKNRALRHVFFVDFDNGVTKEGLCKYYGIEDIKVNLGEKRR
jgi:hypothetical protein